MDINDHLQPIVASLIDNLKVSIEAELKEKVSDAVVQQIAGTEINSLVTTLVKQQVEARLANFNYAALSQEELKKSLTQITSQLNSTLLASATSQITQAVSQRLAQTDLNVVIQNVVHNKLATLLENHSFPEKSVPHTSVDFNGFTLSGDMVSGGIIEHFGSTGIEDRSTFVQMTLMDHAVVFEGPMYAPEIQVKGDIIIDGTLKVLGAVATDTPVFAKLIADTTEQVKAGLDTDLFSGFSDIVFTKIKEEGLDLDKIKQGGKEVIKGNQLGYHITDTNIQRLGAVKDLQTQGESYLSQTLYATTGRVGINTMDPSTAFVVWDEEVELVMDKRSQDIGYIGTPRAQQLVLGSNNKENIKMDTDGSTQIDNILIGKVPMTSAAAVPNFRGKRGQIIWNEQPVSGGAIGWVCLGDTRWAKFGTIE